MTNREAIEILEEDKTSIDSSISDGIANAMTLQRYIDFSEALDLAIQALEKQWPKEPEVDCHIGDMDCNSYDYHKCPECGTEVYRAYCPECGQALKWVVLDES